jgi:hypothetical protein
MEVRMDSLKDIRNFTNEKGLWFAVADLAKRLGKASTTLRRQAEKSCLALNEGQVKTPSGSKSLLFIHEKDLFALIVGLRATGEFAESIKHAQMTIMNKGLEQVNKQIEQPKRKHFQRFPDPIVIPDKPIRACIVEYIRKVAIVMKVDTSGVFRQLYIEFKYRFGIDLSRHTGFKTGLDKCADLEKLQELYATARAMYDEYIPEENTFALEDKHEELPPASN